MSLDNKRGMVTKSSICAKQMNGKKERKGIEENKKSGCWNRRGLDLLSCEGMKKKLKEVEWVLFGL